MSDISALGSFLRFWDRVAYAATTLVFIGVVGESVIELTSLVKTPERRKRIAKLSALVLILGLAGELLSQSKISELTGEITAILNKEAGDARKAAGEAEERAANLEQKMADRHITLEQRKKMLEILKARPGSNITVWYIINSDKDALGYALEIAEVFRDAKWNALNGPPLISMDTPLDGFLIEVQRDSPSNRTLASLAEKALDVTGYHVLRTTIPADPNLKTDIILLVGSK